MTDAERDAIDAELRDPRYIGRKGLDKRYSLQRADAETHLGVNMDWTDCGDCPDAIVTSDSIENGDRAGEVTCGQGRPTGRGGCGEGRPRDELDED